MRRISGGVAGAIFVSNSRWLYSRKHLPGRVRPARPARCVACTLQQQQHVRLCCTDARCCAVSQV